MNLNHKSHKMIMKMSRHFNIVPKVVFFDFLGNPYFKDYDKSLKQDAMLTFINNVHVRSLLKLVINNKSIRAFRGTDNMFFVKEKGVTYYVLIDVNGDVVLSHILDGTNKIFDPNYELKETDDIYDIAKKNYDMYMEDQRKRGVEEDVLSQVSILAFVPMHKHGDKVIQNEDGIYESFKNFKDQHASIFTL